MYIHDGIYNGAMLDFTYLQTILMVAAQYVNCRHLTGVHRVPPLIGVELLYC